MKGNNHKLAAISSIIGVGALLFFITNCIKLDSSKTKSEHKTKKIVHILQDLDTDTNGLYDDVERKAMLDVISKQCPELKIKFDTNNDGKVSIEEQTQDRHPLSQLIPRDNIIKNNNKIPWSINLFPEWIMTAYLQDDVLAGIVEEQSPRGLVKRVATQTEAHLRPEKISNKGGIEFAANSGEFLQMPGVKDARWSYRWMMLNFRIDAHSGKGMETVLLDINKGRWPSYSSPKVWYSKKDGLSIQYVGKQAGGIDKRIMVASNVIADGKTWNSLVCGTRQGIMFATVNGTALSTSTKQADRFSTPMIPKWEIVKTSSFIGDSDNKNNMSWALDSLVLGQTEPSEGMVKKLSGWAANRLVTQELLPNKHPYKNVIPVLDAEDFPHRYVHDNDKWLEWHKSLTKDITRVNAGGPRLAPSGYERVFFDDFRTQRISDSTTKDGDLWTGPGFNTAVGGALPLLAPKQKPNVYPYDAANKKQIVSLVQGDNKSWSGSALYSINDMGQGYTWDGPKVFRIRCKFPKVAQKDLAKGLFPAFWSYGTEWIYWRTSNRIECDWFEFDGKNGGWLNGIATHYHYPHTKSIFAKSNKSYKRTKAYGGDLKEAKSKIPGGIYMWDGEYHTWEFVIEKDMTYINISKEDEHGKETWYEIGRAKTAPIYLERLDVQVNYALHGGHGPPTAGRQDFIIDFIEVMQKKDQLAQIPKIYTARPQLSGDFTIGSVVQCDAKLKEINDIRYYWFADDYPLTYGSSNKYTITEADAGKEIRCMVKAVGALDMPEAWSHKVSVK